MHTRIRGVHVMASLFFCGGALAALLGRGFAQAAPGKIPQMAASAPQLVVQNGHVQRVTETAFSPNGSLLATCGADWTVKVWDLHNGTMLYSLPIEGGRHVHPTFSPDSERGLRIWDPTTGRLKATLMPLGMAEDSHSVGAWIAFTPDGDYAASDGAEASLRWRVAGEVVKGEQYQAERRRPERVEQSLTGKVEASLIAQTRREAALWQARPQTAALAPTDTTGRQQAAGEAPVDPQSPNALLRKALSRVYVREDPPRIAGVIREIKPLLTRGADPNVQGAWGTSPLMFFAISGDLEGVKDLVHRGVKLDLQEEDGHTALLYAVAAHHPEIVQFLLKVGAGLKDVEEKSLLPLRGHPEALGLALTAALNRPVMFHTGRWTREEDAKWKADVARWQKFDSEDTALLLLQWGALPNTRDKKGNTALQYGGSVAVIEALLAHGADINVTSKNSYPPLIDWAMGAQVELVRIALAHGANVNIATERGTTALFYAAQNGHEEVARLLLAHHADPNRPIDDGRTPLMLALSEGHLDIVRQLLNHGAKLEARDSEGWTALTYAVNRQDQQAVRLLLDKGANVQVRTKKGEGLLKLLQMNDKGDSYGVAALLKKSGCRQ